MPESKRDRWLSIGMSVLLHGSLIALLALGWWHFREQQAPPQSVPINATVVDARTLKGVGTAPTPAPQPKQPPPQAQPEQETPPPEGPPPPTPDELAMREQAAKEEAQHEQQAEQQLLARQQAEAARAAAEQQAEAQAAAKAAAAKQAEEAEAAAQAQKVAEAKKAAEVKKKAAKLAAEKKLAQQRKLAEEKKLAQEKKLAEQKALAAQRQAEAERAARVADLQQSLREDERAAAASGALASWQSQLESRIQQRWIRPPTAQPGIDCVLNVSVVSGGDVTDVSLGQCNGDDAVRESIKNAVYAASPLPPPPNNIAFPHQLVIEFKPTN
jgi:colicin import membrane protein